MKAEILKAVSSLGILRSENSNNHSSFASTASIIPPARTSRESNPRSLDAVYRALTILETAARQLTLDVWRGADKIPAPSIVAYPSLSMAQSAFIGETVNSLAQRGNAYWLIHRAGQKISNLEILNPLYVTGENDENARPHYYYYGKPIPRTSLIHLKLTHVPGELFGLSPLQACEPTLRGAVDMRRYADNWTAAPGRPTGVLSTEQKLTAEQAEEYKNQANRMFTPGNGIAVLGNGLTFSRLLLDPKEIQFLESQQANVISIARMFGIPARHMLASIEGGTQTYANLEQEEITFVRYTLMQYLREIEEAFNRVTPHGNTVRFNLEGLLRTDTKTRYEAHAIALNAGFLTINEVREIEGLAPLTTPPPPAPEPVESQIEGEENATARRYDAPLHVVCGAPASGKNTFINENKTDGAVIIDQDALNMAFGAEHRKANEPQRNISFTARRSAVDEILAQGAQGETWIIHSKPSDEQIATYKNAGAEFHVLAPPIEEVLARAGEDDRPDGTEKLIKDWYANPPVIEKEETDEQ